MSTQRIIYAINARGYRVGESHPNAKISDREVDWIRGFHEVGVPYSVIVAVTGLPKTTIASICQYQRRAETPERYRTVRVEIKDTEV